MKYLPTLKRVTLTEYASDSAFEKYTSIVLDKEDNAFKVVTGEFHDKRDAYEKLSARGMIVRKTFESKIWDWIERNAPNNLTAYLMFSTAFSKWKGNNILNDYYIKLLNDIPALNREKIKGDPNSMGLDKVQRESVLTEVKPEDPHYVPNEKGRSDSYKLTPDEKRMNFNIDKWLDSHPRLKNVRVTPRNQNGSLSKFARPLEIKSTYTSHKPDSEKFSEESFIDPDFLKALFNEVYIMHTGEAFPAWAPFVSYQVEVDGEPIAEITKTRLPELLKTAIKNERAELDKVLAGKQDSDINTDDETIDSFRAQYRDAVANGQIDKAKNILRLLKDTQKAAKRTPANDLDMANYQACKQVKDELSKLSTSLVNKDNNYSKEGLDRVINDRLAAIQDTLNNANDFAKISEPYKDLQGTQALLRLIQSGIPEGRGAQEAIRTYAIQLKGTIDEILARGIKSKDTRQAYRDLKARDNGPEALQQKVNDLYSSPSTSVKNPIRGGDMYANFNDKLDRSFAFGPDKKAQADNPEEQIKKLEKQKEYYQNRMDSVNGPSLKRAYTDMIAQLDKEIADLKSDAGIQEEATVNQGAETTYLTQPKQPVLNRSAMIPVNGTVVEDVGQFNPELFEGSTLKPEVREALLRVAQKFEEKLDLELKPVDIYLTGSNANYNYNSASDIDLHLVYDYEKVGAAAEMFKRYLIAQKKVFNSDYDIYVKGIKVEVGAEDTNNPLVAGGVYSLVSNDWKKTPSQDIEMSGELPPYMTELINEIEQAIQSHDSAVIGNLWKALGELRKASLAAEGEFGAGNLMFKKLRADGYLERLKDAYYDSASQELSLESLEEI